MWSAVKTALGVFDVTSRKNVVKLVGGDGGEADGSLEEFILEVNKRAIKSPLIMPRCPNKSE